MNAIHHPKSEHVQNHQVAKRQTPSPILCDVIYESSLLTFVCRLLFLSLLYSKCFFFPEIADSRSISDCVGHVEGGQQVEQTFSCLRH